MLLATQAHAFDYQIDCDEAKRLTGYSIAPGADDSTICAAYNSKGLKCYDSASNQNEQEDSIYLTDPMDTYYSNRSGRYKLSRLREVVTAALEDGSDPYIALAIMSLENPLTGSEASEDYARNYGNPPIDGPGAASAIGCKSIKKDGITELRNRSATLSEWRVSDLPTRQLFKIFADNFAITSPVSDPALRDKVLAQIAAGEAPDSGCYFWFLGGEADWTANPNDQVNENKLKAERAILHSLLGARYMSKKMEYVRDLISKGKGLWATTDTWYKYGHTSTYRLAIIAQGYNGHGTYGRGEFANNCQDGINMAEKPLYGAGAMHLALNVFLGNQQIRDFVDSESTRLKLPAPTSLLCSVMGSGRHLIAPESFANIQRRIIKPREATFCSKHTHTYNW